VKKRLGFTLIELVIVIAVLGLLAGIAIPRFLDAQATAKGAKVLADLRTIDSAINLYMAGTGTEPTDVAQLTEEAGTNGKPILASVPVPPSGEFIITKNDGSTKTYEEGATLAYTIVDDRAVYVPSETGAGTVEWYLSGAGSGSGTNTVPGINVPLSGNGWPPQSYWDTHDVNSTYSMSAGEVFEYNGQYYIVVVDSILTKGQAATGPNGDLYNWYGVEQFTGRVLTSSNFDSSSNQISDAARGDCYQASDGSLYVFKDGGTCGNQSGS
jgi:prepilin-type N-terminal cleavage/methylation domain-containing protein